MKEPVKEEEKVLRQETSSLTKTKKDLKSKTKDTKCITSLCKIAKKNDMVFYVDQESTGLASVSFLFVSSFSISLLRMRVLFLLGCESLQIPKQDR